MNAYVHKGGAYRSSLMDGRITDSEEGNMLLAFDVGNTNIVLGVFKDGELIENWRMETDNKRSADEYGMVIKQLFEYSDL